MPEYYWQKHIVNHAALEIRCLFQGGRQAHRSPRGINRQVMLLRNKEIMTVIDENV